MAEKRRCSILFHFEVPGGKWHTVISSPVRGGELAEAQLPQPVAVAVGAAGVGGDQQAGGVGIGDGTDLVPPPPDRGHRELGGVGVVTDDHEALVGGDVEHPVGDRLADVGVGEVVHVDTHRHAGRLPFAPAVAEVPDDLVLFRVHRHHRLTSFEVAADVTGDVAELGVTIRMGSPFVLLGRRLQAVTHAVQQLTDGHVRDLETSPPQLAGQRPRRLRRPPQRAHRITPGLRLDQRIQRHQQTGLSILHPRTPGTRRPHPHRHLDTGVDLPDRLVHRRTAHSRRLGHRHDPTPAQSPRRRAGQNPTLPLIQMRQHRRQHRRQPLVGDDELAHPAKLTHPTLNRADYTLPSPNGPNGVLAGRRVFLASERRTAEPCVWVISVSRDHDQRFSGPTLNVNNPWSGGASGVDSRIAAQALATLLTRLAAPHRRPHSEPARHLVGRQQQIDQ